MSWKVNEAGNITMTRGDTPSFKVNVKIKDEEGELHPYTPLPSDEIIFAVKRNDEDAEILIQKTIPNDTCTFMFEESDTKELEFGTYIYEISLNSGDYHCTFITNKKLRLTSELY